HERREDHADRAGGVGGGHGDRLLAAGSVDPFKVRRPLPALNPFAAGPLRSRRRAGSRDWLRSAATVPVPLSARIRRTPRRRIAMVSLLLGNADIGRIGARKPHPERARTSAN